MFALMVLPLFALGADNLVQLTSENPFPGKLAGIDREWNLSFRTGVPGAEKVRVVPAAAVATWGRWHEAEGGPQVLLVDGSLIRADILKLDGESVVLGDATGLGRTLWDESTLPRSSVRAIIYQPPAGTTDRDRLFAQLAKEEGTDDRLLLVGGETLSGSIVRAPVDGRFLPENESPGRGTFELLRRGGETPLSIPASKVSAVVLASPPFIEPTGMTAWIGCRDGSLLQVSSIAVEDGTVKQSLAAGGTLVAPLAGRDDPDGKFWDEVTLIEPRSPNVSWLSDLKTLGYKHIPFLSIAWPYENDLSVTGGRLRTEGEVVRKGIGMHSTSRLAYDVAGFRRFNAELALDQSAGKRGSVVFKVLLQDAAGQWQPAYVSPVVRGGEPAIPLSIELKGATRMALLIEPADRGDELDHANWLRARLVK